MSVSTAEATRRFALSSGDAIDNVANPIQILPLLGGVAAFSKVRRNLIEPVLWIFESDVQEVIDHLVAQNAPVWFGIWHFRFDHSAQLNERLLSPGAGQFARALEERGVVGTSAVRVAGGVAKMSS